MNAIESRFAVGDRVPVDDQTQYTVLDVDRHLVKVVAEPRPLWAGAAWIDAGHLALLRDDHTERRDTIEAYAELDRWNDAERRGDHIDSHGTGLRLRRSQRFCQTD
jgi:hypothetical protein